VRTQTHGAESDMLREQYLLDWFRFERMEIVKAYVRKGILSKSKRKGKDKNMKKYNITSKTMADGSFGIYARRKANGISVSNIVTVWFCGEPGCAHRTRAEAHSCSSDRLSPEGDGRL
jgi:hypothetical protein